MGTRKSKSKSNRPMLKPSKPNASQASTMTVGEELRCARERSGVTVEETAKQLRLTINVVRALEEDVCSKLPEPIYVRGYIRSYSRLLSLPGDSLVEKYNAGLSEQIELHLPDAKKMSDAFSPSVSVNHKNKRYVIYLLSVIVVGLILLLSLLYWSGSDYDGSPGTGLEKVSIEGADGRLIFEDFSSEGGEVSPIVQPQNVESTASDLAQQTITTEKNVFASFIDSLFVSVKEECWIKVTDGSGGTLHSALMSPGESLSLSGSAPFKVVVGNVHGVSLNFNGEQVNLDSFLSRQSRVAVVKLGG